MSRQTKHKKKLRKVIIGRMHTPCPSCYGHGRFQRFSIFSWHGLMLYRLSRRLGWQWLAYRTCSKCKGKEYR